MVYKKKRFLREKLNYSLIIEYKKLFHYESLLIGEIGKIESEYDAKINRFKISGIISGIISFAIPILGYTNDVIGIKILMNISNNQNLIKYVLVLSPFIISSILSFFVVYKTIKIMESIKLKFIKDEFTQTRIFLRYMREKAKKQNIINESNDSEVIKYYYSGNRSKISFIKPDLKNYISKYFQENNKNIDCYEVSIFLSEIIISRGLIKKDIKKAKDGTYEYIIDKSSIIKLIYN